MGYFYEGVVLLNVLAIVSIFLRPRLFNVNLFRPMLKNIFLSILPVVMLFVVSFAAINFAYIGYQVSQYALVITGFIVGVIGMLAWLLMLPNAGYLITELNLTHREVDEVEVPLWYDIISVLTLSMSGVINTLVNVLIVQILYISLFYPTIAVDVTFSTHPFLWFLTGGLFVLVSVGIYIGRYTRLNSWDVVHPRAMARKLKDHFSQQGSFKSLLLFTLLYSIFFFLLYLIVVVPLFEGGLVW